MSDKFFLDTNIFVYSFDDSDKRKQQRAREIITRSLRDRSGIISWQVVQEFLNVAMRKFQHPMTATEAQAYLTTVLGPLCQIFPQIALYEEAAAIKERFQLSFYDALIVASAAEGNCNQLLSEDFQIGQNFEGVRVQNPFLRR